MERVETPAGPRTVLRRVGGGRSTAWCTPSVPAVAKVIARLAGGKATGFCRPCGRVHTFEMEAGWAVSAPLACPTTGQKVVLVDPSLM